MRFLRLPSGYEPARQWLDSLSKDRRLIVLAYLGRLVAGASQKNVKHLGNGVLELKINHGPGYRIYFALNSKGEIFLLGGGDKGSQWQDIKRAKEYWRMYETQE